MNDTTKQYFILAGVLVVILGAVFLLKEKNENQVQSDNILTPVNQISHGHGLSADVDDPSKVYIATHYGLFLLQDDKDLYRIGSSQDDFMGFSTHPTDSKIFFTSGHPVRGGNLGVQKSEDGGVTWQKISDGVRGPVDFHAMEISRANPDVMYGWYNRALQRSLDMGHNWEIVNSDITNILSLTSDPEDENKVYAATSQGIMVSEDKGETWNSLSEELKEVTVLGISPDDPMSMLVFSIDRGLMKSVNGGSDWQELDFNFGGDVVMYIAFQPQNPDNVYTLTRNSSVYKSMDKGISWNKIY